VIGAIEHASPADSSVLDLVYSDAILIGQSRPCLAWRSITAMLSFSARSGMSASQIDSLLSGLAEAPPIADRTPDQLVGRNADITDFANGHKRANTVRRTRQLTTFTSCRSSGSSVDEFVALH